MVFEIIFLILILWIVVAVVRRARAAWLTRQWWARADAAVRQQLEWLELRGTASATIDGLPFDGKYLRRARRMAGRAYKVSLVESENYRGRPALLIVPKRPVRPR